MTVTLNKIPPFYAMAEHELVFEAQRTGFPTGGSAALIAIGFPNSIAAESSFTLTFMGADHTFTFSASPADDGRELRTWPEGMAKATYLLMVIEDLLKNYYILKHYIPTKIADNSGIKLTAKQYGPAYAITMATEIESMTTQSSHAGVDSITPVDYRVYMSLQSNGSIMAEELVPVNMANIATADFKSYIKGLLSLVLTYPAGTNKVVPHLQSTLALKLLYAERYDNYIRTLAEGETFYAVPGNLAQTDKDLLAQAGDLTFFGNLALASRFMSWCPRNKQTAWQVPERLYYLNTLSGSYTVKAVITFANASTETISLTGAISQQHIVYEITCGLHEIDPDVDVATVEKYSIGVYNGSSLVSELFEFEIDNQERYKSRVLVFRNSLGAFDSLRCTGPMQIADRLQRDEMEVVGNRVYRMKINRADNLPVFRLSTGYLPGLDYRLWLTELLLSKEVYWLTDAGYLLPVVLTGSDYERYADKKFLHPVMIEFKPDVAEEAFSDIVGNRLNVIRDEDGIELMDEDGIVLTDL